MKKRLLSSILLSIGLAPVFAQNPGMVVSEAFINPSGSDSPFEWVELKVTENIDFTATPYTVVVCNNGSATLNGWVEGGSKTYAFEITTGSVQAGDVVYVGGSQMAPTGTQIRTIHTGNSAGDGFGNANSGGVMGNGGGNADGIAVFRSSSATLTANSVPVDAVFYGDGIGGAELNGGQDGYQLPINDLYNGGKLSANSFFCQDPGGDHLVATGAYDTLNGNWSAARTFTTEANFTDGTSLIALTDGSVPPQITLESDFEVIAEDAGTYNLQVSINGGNAEVTKVAFELSVWSTGVTGADFTLASDTLFIPANSTGVFNYPITILDDALAERSESVIFKIVDVINGDLTGENFQILFIQDNDYVAPVASNTIKMDLLTSFSNGVAGDNTAEIAAYDVPSKRLFVSNSEAAALDIIDLQNPASPVLISTIDISTYGNINSVAVNNGLVVLAIENTDPQANGSIVFMDINGGFVNSVPAGPMPDMVTFNKDFTKVLAANEGEPNADYTVDPEGSISIVDLSAGIANLSASDVTTVDFTAFNADLAALQAAGVRIINPAQNVAQDLEPEYISISEDNTTAYVSLQENNAIAVIDIASATVTEIRALGFSDHMAGGLDASNESGEILIASFPVMGAYMPDAIATGTINGQEYIFSANEGDVRELDDFIDEDRIKDFDLDPSIFTDQEILKHEKFLGRLKALAHTGDTDGDGDLDEIHSIGSRSFSIWDAATGDLVFDSQDLFEQIIANDPVFVDLFNASNSNDEFKNRSDDKGPEPEGVVFFQIKGDAYVAVGLERVGGVMLFEVNNPSQPVYVGYYNNRINGAEGPDLGAEGLLYISEDDSPNGAKLLILANEVSSTLSIYEINTCVDLISSEITNEDLTFCEGSDITLNVADVAGTQYQWIANGTAIAGANSFSHTTATAGDYAVYVSNTDEACADTSEAVTVTSENCLSVADLESQFAVYPNPTTGKVAIEMNNQASAATVRIFDLNGRQYETISITSLKTIVDLTHLNKGVYLMQLSSIDHSQTIRLTVH